MWQRPFFHQGMSELQDRFDGRRVAETIERHRKHYEFWDDEKEMIETSPFFFIGTSFDDYVDCSVKSGDPGFVKIVEPNIIEYRVQRKFDAPGARQSLPKSECGPAVRAFRRQEPARIRVNGRASILDNAEALGRHFDAQLVVRIEREIYPNCPRYVPDLAGAKPSPYVPREGQGPPPAPEWKYRDYIRDILPKGDPHSEIVKASAQDG